MIGFARAVQLHQAARQATVVVTMVALAQLGLGLAEIGNFEGLRYVAYALTVFWLNGLGNAYLRVRQVTAFPERWFIFFLLLVLIGSLLVFGLFATALPLLGGLLLDSPSLDYGLPFGAFVLGSLAGSVVEQEAIADRRPERLLVYSLSSSVLQIGLFVGPLLFGLPFYLAMWGLAASGIYRLMWTTSSYLSKRDALLPPAGERRVFWRSASGLSVYGLTAVLVIMVDHALVGYTARDPESAVALWRYGAQELPLLLGVVTGLNATALAEMQEGATRMLAQLKRRMRKINRVFLPLAIVLAASCRWWYPSVFSEAFYPAHVIFTTMLLVVPSRLVSTTPLLVSLDMQRIMTFTGLAEAALNVIVSILLLPSLGLLGVAVGTVVAYSAEKLVYVWLLSRRGFPAVSYLDRGEWLLGTVVLLAAYFVGTDFSALARV